MSLPNGYQEVEASKLPQDFIHRLAEATAREIGFDPLNTATLTEKIHKRLGGSVIEKDFWITEDSGSIRIEKQGNFTIYVPDRTSPERRRFTIAHELGHYILHFLWPILKEGKQETPSVASRYGSDRVEWEANWFAAAFLMPAKPFRDVWLETAKNKNRMSTVAKTFGVSKQAATLRAKELGLS